MIALALLVVAVLAMFVFSDVIGELVMVGIVVDLIVRLV